MIGIATADAKRTSLLDVTMRNLVDILQDNAIFSKTVSLDMDSDGISAYRIKGPRAGALEVLLGTRTGEVLKKLTSHDNALLRQVISWQYPEDRKPSAYLTGNRLRIEAPWPLQLQNTDITLTQASYHHDGRRFTTGVDECGTTIRVGFSDEVPHILISGQTGSGKSYSMRSIGAQLGLDSHTKVILIDAKYGDGLGKLSYLPNQIGPIATDIETARKSLGWATSEMIRRYRNGVTEADSQIVILFDEFQEFTSDKLVAEYFRAIGAKGRGAKVRLLAATQYPQKSMFGPDAASQTLKQHFVGRIVHAVGTLEASMLAVGDSFPRADRTLLGKGDAYILPKPGSMYRVQMAYIPEDDLKNWRSDSPKMQFSEWPEVDTTDLEAEANIPESKPGRKQRVPSGEELGAALWYTLAELGGRDRLSEFLRDECNTQIGAGATSRIIHTVDAIATKFRALGGELVV